MVCRNDLGILFISEFWAELKCNSPVYTQEEWIRKAWITDIAHVILGMSNLCTFSAVEKWKEGFVKKIFEWYLGELPPFLVSCKVMCLVENFKPQCSEVLTSCCSSFPRFRFDNLRSGDFVSGLLFFPPLRC